MKQAASLSNLQNEVLLPGILVNNRPNDFFPIEQFRLMRFKGKQCKPFGNICLDARDAANAPIFAIQKRPRTRSEGNAALEFRLSSLSLPSVTVSCEIG
jgi:hypothetical protein